MCDHILTDALDRLAAARDIIEAPLPADEEARHRARQVRLGWAQSAINGVYEALSVLEEERA